MKRSFKPKSTGYLSIRRKLPQIWTQNSGSGTVTIYTEGGAPYAGDALQLGTPVVGISGAYDVPFSLQFKLNELIGSSDITHLADKYRIKGAYVKLIPSWTDSSSASPYTRPYVEYFTDHDDNTPPSMSLIRERMGVKTKTFNSGRYVGIMVKPSIAIEVFKTTLSTGYAPKYGQWLDCNDSTVPHYGIKGVIRGYNLVAPTTLKQSLMFDVTLHVEAKDFQ